MKMSGMNWNFSEPPTRLKLIGVLILLVGLGTAAWIYHGADTVPYGALGYEGGYPIMPEDSKQYLRSMELYGGKANVLADELRRWLGGLFHGKSLAFIIACTSIIIALGIFYAANHSMLPSESEPGSDSHDDGTD